MLIAVYYTWWFIRREERCRCQMLLPFCFLSVQMQSHSRWLYKCRILCWFHLCSSLDISFFTTSFSLSAGPDWSCFLGLYPLGFPRHCPVLVDILLIGFFDGSPFSPFGDGFPLIFLQRFFFFLFNSFVDYSLVWD